MNLLDAQMIFSRLVARLLQEAGRMGFEVTLGEAWRSPEEAARRGFPNSNHTRRLAIDLNLFRDRQYQRDTAAHRPLGEWWEAQHELARWGGRFGDGNHYSLEWEGIR